MSETSFFIDTPLPTVGLRADDVDRQAELSATMQRLQKQLARVYIDSALDNIQAAEREPWRLPEAATALNAAHSLLVKRLG